MEEVGGRGHVTNLHVAILVLTVELLWFREYSWIFITELEVALHSSGGVLRTLTIIAVRQRHYKTRTLHPLDFSRCDELINDALGVVGEITKLRLPNDKGVGRRQRVSVFEAKTVIVC